MIITALVNTEIVPSVLFGIFAGALSVVLEIDNTQYHIKDVFRASEDSTIVKYVCDDKFPAQDLKFTKIN